MGIQYLNGCREKYTQSRTGNYEKRDNIAAKWDFTKKTLSVCGNINTHFSYDNDKNSFVFKNDWDSDDMCLYNCISSPMLLYRLIATFFNSPLCGDNYKWIWRYPLLHKSTGEFLEFGEWKGSPEFFSRHTDFEKLPEEFKFDLIELLNYLVSNECTHPYDNTVAGSQA